MQTHVSRSTTATWFGTKYRLSVRIFADLEELAILRDHHLDRVEVFADPQRDDFNAAAMAAHDKAKARGLFIGKARDTSAIAAAELTAIFATVRALLAFNLRVSDLLRGVTIEHRSPRAIVDIETTITEFTDRIDAAVCAARGYDHRSEDVFAPGTDEDGTVPPGQWTRSWRP